MKTITLIFLALFSVASATDIVIFNPRSSPITNRVTGVLLSQNTPSFVGVPGALIISDRSLQILMDVTAGNIVSHGVVSNQFVRLLTSAELSEIAATNAIIEAESVELNKQSAREYATNVVTAVDGQSLFLRSIFKATWLLINNTRTNAGQPVISQNTFLSIVQTNIADFGK